ncbi:glycosyltransferase family 4 protein [Peristeroidobacter soli]|uniref:glycosyltransferase family 4 protein n=1 Tax=Peristeroidobacter soli TaxID=2497877 RepID=UPI00101C9A6D|nr:glycosyltransferase family 4 protein [Peristeroidobacter soli]
MKLLAIAEHFPSPYKAYHYVQFERFLQDGHELTVYAFGLHDGGMGNGGQEGAFVRQTRYLPPTARELPSFFGQALRDFVRRPGRALQRSLRAFAHPASLKHRCLNMARALLLPADSPDMVLVHNLRAAANLQFLRAIYPEAVIAMYYHGGEVPGVPTPSVATVKATFDSFDVVFTNTESSRKHAIGRGQAAERIVISPVGFDLRGFPDPQPRAYRRDGKLNIFMVGRLSEEKGFMLGLQALKVLIQEGHDIKVRLAGDGPLRKQLASFIADNGLDRHIEMLGRVEQDQLYRCYTEADVFLLPSIPAGTWEENQACVVQEAMLFRAVAAVSRTGGVGESTAPTMLPFSFEPGDVEGMVAGLRKLVGLSEEQLRALGAEGRAFAQSRYDIRVLNAELLSTALTYARDAVVDDDDSEEAIEAA